MSPAAPLRFAGRELAFWTLALIVAAGLASPARGGGPLVVVNHQPVVYANGGTSLTLNLDRGPLGTRTNAQAAALVQSAIALWNGVSTSTLRLLIGTQLGADYTAANYLNVYQNVTDGVNPVFFDSDGSIIDSVFGVGAKNDILGFAGSSYFTAGPMAGHFAEGSAVLNGYLSVSDATLTTVLAHEFGHFFGLDHSQLDNSQGLAPSNYALMYPIAYRTLMSLHEDDAAAVTSLYPAASVATTYGRLTGTFTTAGGTPILGANIWARESSTGKVYSVVSDFLLQSSGYFDLYLPAGSYTLHAESIQSTFNGGSGVGPYAETSGDVSFQSPHPIAPIALGGGAGESIVITAGCVATATFRFDGTGGIGGNCASSSAAMPGAGTVVANPYGALSVQGGTLNGNTISNPASECSDSARNDAGRCRVVRTDRFPGIRCRRRQHADNPLGRAGPDGRAVQRRRWARFHCRSRAGARGQRRLAARNLSAPSERPYRGCGRRDQRGCRPHRRHARQHVDDRADTRQPGHDRRWQRAASAQRQGEWRRSLQRQRHLPRDLRQCQQPGQRRALPGQRPAALTQQRQCRCADAQSLRRNATGAQRQSEWQRDGVDALGCGPADPPRRRTICPCRKAGAVRQEHPIPAMAVAA